MLCLTLYISIAMSCNLLFNNVGKLAKLNSCSYVEVRSQYTALKARSWTRSSFYKIYKTKTSDPIQIYKTKTSDPLLIYKIKTSDPFQIYKTKISNPLHQVCKTSPASRLICALFFSIFPNFRPNELACIAGCIKRRSRTPFKSITWRHSPSPVQTQYILLVPNQPFIAKKF